MDIYYKSDFTLIETFLDENGDAIDMTAIDFKIDYYTLSNAKYTVSKTAAVYVNCEAGSATNQLNVFFQKHGMPAGKLQREITLYITNPDFSPTEKVMTNPVSDIILVAKGGDGSTASASIVYPAIVVPPTYYDIKDLADSTGLRTKWNAKLDIEDLQDADTKDAIADTDEFNYLDSEDDFKIVKTTFTKIKAFFKTFFDTIYASITHNHNLNDLTEKSYNSLTDTPSLDFEPANENIQSHIGDGDIHVTSEEKSTWSGKQDALTFSTDIETDKASTTKISAIKTFYDWAVGKFIDLTKIVTTWTAITLDTNIPSEKLVKDSLNLKADITPANGSTSALRELFLARGNNAGLGTIVSYDTNTNTYTMNGVTELSESDMLDIYNQSNVKAGGMAYSTIKTNFPNLERGLSELYGNSDINRICFYNRVIKIFSIKSFGEPVVTSIVRSFQYCAALEKIITYPSNGYISLDKITTATNLELWAGGCISLKEFYFTNLKVNFDVGTSPLVALNTLQFLVTNRANGTTRITITVHATVWSKLNDAENYPTWNALLVEANNQYIAFATV